jgi:hypothetical protein
VTTLCTIEPDATSAFYVPRRSTVLRIEPLPPMPRATRPVTDFGSASSRRRRRRANARRPIRADSQDGDDGESTRAHTPLGDRALSNGNERQNAETPFGDFLWPRTLTQHADALSPRGEPRRVGNTCVWLI